jgi:hypothetical protein
MKNILFSILMIASFNVCAQKFNLGITFQYHILKQVAVDSDVIVGKNSYSLYYVRDNRWKFFSAGQSIVIGTVLQLDYKKLYFALEPSYNLNTYNYTVGYPVGASSFESITFKSLYFQIDLPLYVGYQFKSSNLIRYSVFAGVVPVIPYHIEFGLQSRAFDNPQRDYVWSGDLGGVLYDPKPYANTLVGLCLHFASLGKVDVRYLHRLGSTSEKYDVTFNTVGAGITYYLPLNLFKRKIYYED